MSSDDMIRVWIVTPGEEGFDETWFDDEEDAGSFAAERAYLLWDDRFENAGMPPDPSPQERGPGVTITVREMTRAEFVKVFGEGGGA